MQGLRAIGLMSGTSLDGIDAAVLETDGTSVLRFGPTGYRPYGEAERACLRQALAEAVQLRERAARPGVLGEAERLVTRLHGDAVEALLAAHGIARSAIDVVGFHGQTLLHRPPPRLTVPIGDGAALAARVGGAGCVRCPRRGGGGGGAGGAAGAGLSCRHGARA